MKSYAFPIEEVDPNREFNDYPKIFSSVADIEAFIEFRNLKDRLPILSAVLKLRRDNKLDLTPTENKFYFDSLFGYIYDVYRIPTEQNYQNIIQWLEHLEDELVWGGINYIIKDCYDNVGLCFYTFFRFHSNPILKLSPKIINYYTEIGDIEHSDYYKSKKSDVIEQFWIKSDRNSGQPVIVGDEAYMRVHVYKDRVYILGCDDFSWTYYTKENKPTAEDFAFYLKSAAPVWNFMFTKCFGKNFEFTN